MQLEAFNRGDDPGGEPEIGADNPPDDIVPAERYQCLSLLAQGLDMGVGGCNVGRGGDATFQQSDMLSHHGFGLRFQYAGCHQSLDIRVSVEDQRRLYRRSYYISLLHRGLGVGEQAAAAQREGKAGAVQGAAEERRWSTPGLGSIKA